MSTSVPDRTVPVPEPELKQEEMIARAEALRPLLREEQEASEERGHYSEAIHEEFVKAGFYRVIQPRRFGGYEFDLPTFYRLATELSRGDPSTGWCFCLTAGHAMQLGSLFTEEAQAEAFGPNGDFLAPSRATPLGTAERVDGGWLINGTWDYCSGAPYATHFMPVAVFSGENGEQPAGPAYAVIPRSQWTMLDDWGGDVVLGLRGSGSNSIEVKDAVVPEHFVILENLLDLDVSEGTVGYRLHGNPMYAGRALGFFHGELLSIALGALRAALDEFEQIIRTRKTMFPPIVPRYEQHDYQRTLGLALGIADAVESIVIHAAET
jgi:3-hydroxy-9,10-secoandrosta-1,3,5(10)-triene-9,17-dione monooxygenase